MQPIVHRLTEQYSDTVTFIELNAETDGQAVYESLALRGHPATVIFLPDSTETFRALGVQDEDTLVEEIEKALTIEGGQ
ncbi:MAG: hypothetical protein AAF846_09265 [Chloroflexota bacterium]